MNKPMILGLIFIYFSFSTVLGLECYVCENQEDNNEKCTKTIKNCEYNQDVCLTEIKWGSTPYWSQGAKKQYYISKRCSNKTECATTRHRYMSLCTHIWYQDWVCADCCLGDRCNYYIIFDCVASPHAVRAQLTQLQRRAHEVPDYESGSAVLQPVVLTLSGLLLLKVIL